MNDKMEIELVWYLMFVMEGVFERKMNLLALLMASW